MGQVALPSNYGVEISTDGGTSYSNIPGLREFSLNSDTTETRDVTDFDSANNRREFALGLITPGDGTLSINYDESNAIHQTLETLNSGTAVKIRETIDSRTYTHDVLITSAGVPKRVGEEFILSVGVQKTGATVYAGS